MADKTENHAIQEKEWVNKQNGGHFWKVAL